MRVNKSTRSQPRLRCQSGRRFSASGCARPRPAPAAAKFIKAPPKGTLTKGSWPRLGSVLAQFCPQGGHHFLVLGRVTAALCLELRPDPEAIDAAERIVPSGVGARLDIAQARRSDIRWRIVIIDDVLEIVGSQNTEATRTVSIAETRFELGSMPVL